MVNVTVGKSGKSVHVSDDGVTTYCGKEVAELLGASETPTCRLCLKALSEPGEAEVQPENGDTGQVLGVPTSTVEASEVKAGDVLVFHHLGDGGRYKVVQVGPIKFGHVKLTLDGGQVMKYRANYVLTKAG